ncbi:MAG: choice-of-anchor tandem repeat GloVer-containing protein, partial [Candidatus Cybelea sp.]
MKALDFSRYALSCGLAAALLAGCGGSQPPMGAPSTVRQNATSLACYAQAASLAPQKRARAHYHPLYSFGNGSDGQQPKAGLIDLNGTLYGTTCLGGSQGWGTVFSISTSGTEHELFDFNVSDGGGPGGDLANVGGTLYGIAGGGVYGGGVVFSLTTDGTE